MGRVKRKNIYSLFCPNISIPFFCLLVHLSSGPASIRLLSSLVSHFMQETEVLTQILLDPVYLTTQFRKSGRGLAQCQDTSTMQDPGQEGIQCRTTGHTPCDSRPTCLNATDTLTLLCM